MSQVVLTTQERHRAPILFRRVWDLKQKMAVTHLFEHSHNSDWICGAEYGSKQQHLHPRPVVREGVLHHHRGQAGAQQDAWACMMKDAYVPVNKERKA